MNKLEKCTPWQVQIGFCPKESWFKSKTKQIDLKCKNCKTPYTETDGEIALMTIKGEPNAHLCQKCGEYFIREKGAIDINKARANNQVNKDKLIKQAERLGHRFNTYWNKKEASSHTVDELKKIISSKIKSERTEFYQYLKYEHLDILKEFVDAYNIANEKYPTTYFDAYKDPYELVSEYDTDDNYDHHRWCSFFDATLKLNNKVFSYQWANANGDNDLEDAGFDVKGVWETMSVVEPNTDAPGKDIAIEFGEYLINKAFNKDNLDWNFEQFLKQR